MESEGRVVWKRWAGRVGTAFLWLLTLLLAMGMSEAGLGKFKSAEGWDHWMHEVWGYPSWFRSFIGHSEYAGGILLLLPRIAPYAASYLAIIMLGAFVTVTTRESDLSWFDPLFFTFLLSIIVVARWRGRYRWRTPSPEGTRS